MELKEYQQGVLRKIDRYLIVLAEKRNIALAFVDFQKGLGIDAPLGDYCRDAWDQLNQEGMLPLYRNTDGNTFRAPYLSRHDGLKRAIPSICLKVPTGGGKTLLATCAVERIQTDYLKRQTGFVIWVVPSDAIYRQTWKQLANREHPYRQMLERTSGGRVKLLEKNDSFTKRDVEGRLCVMLLMLPSANRQSKETLRMFRDSGKFASFFPPEDDSEANERLLVAVPNLDENDLAELGWKDGILPNSRSIKQSLGNALRLVRPVIVIDEGHRAYSDGARETMCGFNPQFILELSATPNTNGRHRSNVLVSVPGADLKDEEMIKLPINIINDAQADWKQALTLAHSKLGELQKESDTFQSAKGRYIRPILLVRVERTGREQRDSGFIHSEDVREYLLAKLGAKEEEVRLKTSESDELGSDDLLAENCPVRYIITKDALREGWDCPFAYVLAVLSKTTANTALTQMVGRVLRQPHAQLTGRQPLDECYVFTFDQDVSLAVESVRHGLEQEGMADLASSVKVGNSAGESNPLTRRETIQRREIFRNLPAIFLPRVLYREDSVPEGYRALDYDRDILGELDWNSFSFNKSHDWLATAKATTSLTTALVDIGVGSRQVVSEVISHDAPDPSEEGLDIPFLVRQLLDVVPNPWQGMRILSETLKIARTKLSEQQLYANRLDLLRSMRLNLQQQVNLAAEALFRRKLETGDVSLRLVASTDSNLNWELAKTLEIEVSDDDRPLRRKDGTPLQRTLFETLYQRDFNNLEKETAWYLDPQESVYWWHRIAVNQRSYSLQGWQRYKVYPDFLACIHGTEEGKLRFTVLETKGEQLKGNDDTEYKRKLFELLSGRMQIALRAGEMELLTDPQSITFTILMEQSLKEDLAKVLS